MRCRNCQRTIPATVKFCAYCGTGTAAPAPPPPPAAPLPPPSTVPPQPGIPERITAWVGAHRVQTMGVIAVAVGLLAAALLISRTGGDEPAPLSAPPVQPTSAPAAAVPVVPPALPLADMVEGSLPGIVEIRTDSGLGTGFIVHDAGLVITNKHVVEGNSQVNIRLATGGNYQGSVIGTHSTLDLAYIEMESGDTFSPLALSDSDAIRVGDNVIAIGFPLGPELGREPSVTRGIISAKREDLGFLQTDASLNPGNSGGPLLNENGCVVGVNTGAIVGTDDGQTISGINFAIPVNELREASFYYKTLTHHTLLRL
ncbi:MAG: trypsin-like serine protease [Chloroflexi bacterium]|nr:trypsin-like serine protease [Chloroflexota bacterium]